MPPTVVVTASSGTLPGLVDALRRVPLPVEERPLLTFAPPLDWGPLDRALASVARYGAIALTSPRAARAFGERWQARRGEGSSLPPVWAGGPGTVAALADGVSEVHAPSVSEVGERGSGAALAAAMLEAGVRGPVLFPCGELRREELTAGLQHGGI